MLSNHTATTLIRSLPRGGMTYLFRREQLPEFTRQLLIDLGPAFIKFGQVLSTRVDVLSKPFTDALGKLRDTVPAEPIDVVEPALRRAFPAGRERVFAELSAEPIAAGAVAQVYKARLHSGEQVAVKVLRPRAREAIEENFRVLSFIVAAVQRLSPEARAVNLTGIVGELRELLLSQVDFRQELANYQEFQQVFAEEDRIVVPKVYADISTSEVLVTEFIDAIPPHDFRRLDDPPRTLASRIDSLLDVMVFIEGLCHADMHPGNFFWNQRGQLVVIDLGLVHRVTPEDRRHMLTFYLALRDGFYDFATEYLVQHFILRSGSSERLSRDTDRAVFDDIAALVRKTYFEAVGQPSFSAMFDDLVRILCKYQLQLKPNVSRVFLTMATIEGFLFTVDDTFDMIENVRRKRLEEAEYTSMPHAAEVLLFGEDGTYSVARFADGMSSLDEAYQARDQHILDAVGCSSGHFLIDAGCGRGRLLEAAAARGARALGITLSRVEAEACKARGVEAVWSSWEDFEKNHGNEYPEADAITIVEMLEHMATLHENKVGVLDRRLSRLFAWAHKRLRPKGALFIQCVTVPREFLHDARYKARYDELERELPWLGFPTLQQVLETSKPHFDVLRSEDHSNDLIKTWELWDRNVEAHRDVLRGMMKAKMLKNIDRGLDLALDLARDGVIRLQRLCFAKRG